MSKYGRDSSPMRSRPYSRHGENEWGIASCSPASEPDRTKLDRPYTSPDRY